MSRPEKRKSLSSDHFFHLRFVKAILGNGHRFLTLNPVLFNEKNFCYPHLFHWFLSFCSSKVLDNYKLINLVVNIATVITFSVFQWMLDVMDYIPFDWQIWFISILILLVTPFNFAAWNAKNNGISPRSFGLLLGHMFTYGMILYLIDGGILWLFLLTILAFLIIISSQMATQFFVLGVIILTSFTGDLKMLLVLVGGFGLFILIFPKFSQSYFKGQFNHKRNYALFMAEIFILKQRPSIYRDFVKDIWVRIGKNKLWGAKYTLTNPIIEVLIGFPFLVPLSAYIAYRNSILFPELTWTIGIGLILFFLTSFRKTRFLGEPQRYVEFIGPIIALLAAVYFGFYGLFICLLSIVYIHLFKKLFDKGKNKVKSESFEAVLDFFEKKYSDSWKLTVSNDPNLLKSLPQIGIDIVKPDLSCSYKSKEEFWFYFDGDYNVMSLQGVLEYIEQYKPDFCIWNRKLGSNTSVTIGAHINGSMIFEKGGYIVYQLQ
jgi:hypothetical protein